jgi:peptide/nickel transport system permease protein
MHELDQEYVLTARAKGVPEDQVLGHHAMRNVMLPVVTVIGTRIGFLLSGAVFIENVFSWPGLGTLTRTAATSGDSELVLGMVLVVASGVLVANLLTDLLYLWIDPRARAR